MGMFDSLYEGEGGDYSTEWQTKAYSCNLDCYWVGATMPPIVGVHADSYQVEIGRCRGRWPDYDFTHSLATVIDGVLVNIDNERAQSLPLVNYSGNVIANPPEERASGDVENERGVAGR